MKRPTACCYAPPGEYVKDHTLSIRITQPSVMA
jgi:hypothetical protein